MRLTVFVCGLASLVCDGSAVAQQTTGVRPLPVATLLSARQFAEFDPAVFSPDGELVAYVIRARRDTGVASGTSEVVDAYRTGVGWSNHGSSVWVVNVKTGEQRNVAATCGDSWMPAWSPDGRLLAFVADRAVQGQARQAHVWVWDRRPNHVRVASPVSVRGPQLQWAAGSRRILVQVLPEDVAAGPEVTSDSSQQRASTPRGTVILYRSSRDTSGKAPIEGGWSGDAHPIDLAWLDVATGQVTRLAHRVALGTAKLAPDGNRVAYTVFKRFERAGSQQILWDLMVADAGRTSVAASDIRLGPDGSQFTWAPNSTMLAYRATGMIANGDVWKVGLDGQPPRLLTPSPHTAFADSRYGPLWDVSGQNVFFVDKRSLWEAAVSGDRLLERARFGDREAALLPWRGNTIWSPNGATDVIVQTRNNGTGQAGLAKVDLSTGATNQVLEEDRHYGAYWPTAAIGVAPDGAQLAFAAEDIRHASDLYVVDTSGRTPRRLTTINPELEPYVMGDRRLIDWRTIDGDTVRGLLLLPAGYQQGHRYPLITKVYGGARPAETLTNRFGAQSPAVDNLQLFATRGYAVLLPDIPLTKTGQVMIDLLKVVMPGVDKVVDLGIADPARLGLTGHSFGAYNTIALITETTRFRAAMMADGVADLVAGYGEMARDGTTYGLDVIEHSQFLMDGTPWEQRTRYIENSPIYHLDRVTTPLLIVHGEADGAVSAFLADEIFVGLRRLGKEVLYAKYGGEDHHMASWSYANQLDYWTRTIDWFDTHIGERTADTNRGS